MSIKTRFTEDSYRREPWFKSLCAALLSCNTEEDMANMLRDIGTLSELQAWGERLEVAKQLVRGLSYREVARNTGASTTTVTRVAKFIENGTGGYRKLLNAHRHHRLMAVPVSKEQPVSSVGSLPTPNPTQKVLPNVSVLQKYLHRPQ